MSEMTCPLCGQEMAAIETYAGRGELYCGHCDLTIGGNEAKTPDELTALLEQRTCHMKLLENMHTFAYQDVYECDECGEQVLRETYMGKSEPPKFCPECGRKVIEIEEEAE